MSKSKAEVYSNQLKNLYSYVESNKSQIKHKLAVLNASSYNKQKKVSNKPKKR